MAAKPTVSLGVRVAPEALEIMRRHTSHTNLSQAQLVESLLLGLEAKWVARLSPGERQRHEACTMSRLEFKQICQRERDAVWRVNESYRRADEIRSPASMKASVDEYAPAGLAAHGGQPGVAAQQEDAA
jgi:hypothetical protein